MTFHTGHFQITRSIAAPQARLWHLLTDPKMREAWGAPSDDHVLTIEKADLSEGGSERHRCGPADNPEFLVDTRWYRIMEPGAACFTETLIFGGATVSTSLVSYTLKDAAGATELTIDVTVCSYEGPEMVAEHESGWAGSLERLDRLIADSALPA